MLKLKKTLLSQKPNSWGHPVVTTVLLMMLVLSTFYWQSNPYLELFTANREQIFKDHEYWRLFTTTFLHADIHHFLSNALFFWIFGYLLFGYFGAWVFPTLSLMLGALVNFLTLYFYPENSMLIGASGVVYLMVGFWAVMFVFIHRTQSRARRVIGALGVSLSLFFPTEYEPHVSYAAHGIGFGLGVIAAVIYFFLNREKIRAKEIWMAPEPEEPFPEVPQSDLPEFIDQKGSIEN